MASASPAANGAVGILGLVSAATLWLAFFPPASYTARFVRPAAQTV
jgi:hypothetical protein